YSSSPAPRPPSFPTRRSSDLPRAPDRSVRGRRHGRTPWVLAEEAHQLPRGLGAGRVGIRAVTAPTRPGVARAVDGPLLHEGLPLDRKSTRLNSSHEWISYAVF